jgi:hypothetical protein
MDAALIQWRPLGQILVDRGLLTPEELEEVLLAQQETGRPLGQILVDRRLISAPTLASMLAEQCGVELETDTGFGTGLWTAIQRRHDTENRRRGDLHVVPVPDEPETASGPSVAVEQNGTVEPLAEPAEPRPVEAAEHAHRLELEQLSKELADRLEEANARVVELEEALRERQPSRKGSQKQAAERERAKLQAEQDALAEQAGAVHERELALEARAAELAEHEQVLEGRQRAILTAAADLEQRRRSLEERERLLAPQAAEDERQHGGRLPSPSRPPEPAGAHRWNLETLTRLVEENADEFPDRVDDWRYTLFYLRTEASIDGALPRKFDSLVEECFHELVGMPTGTPLRAFA